MIQSISPVDFSCPWYICGAGPVGKLAEAAAKHAATNDANAVLQAFASWIVAGASWLIDQTIAFLKQTTSIDIGSKWFARREDAMEYVALLLVVPMVLAATIGAVLRQDSKRLVRIYAVGVPLAGTATAAGIALTTEAIAIVDAMCAAITAHAHPYEPFTNIDGDMTHHGMPLIVEILIGSVIVVAGLVLWLELILRSIVIDITVFFLPLGLAAIVWPATAQIAKRFVEVMVAIIGSKFVIVATLTLAAALAEHRGAGAAAAVKACAVLMLAAFAPFALLRLIPLVEVAAIAHMEGMSRRPVRAAAGAASATAGGARSAAGLLFGRIGSDVEGGPVTAGDIPWREADFDIDDLPGAPSGGRGSGGSPSAGWGEGGGAPPGHGPDGGSGSGGAAGSGGAGGSGSSGPAAPSPSPAPPSGGTSGTAFADSPDGSSRFEHQSFGSPWDGDTDGSFNADLPDPSDLPGPLPVLESSPMIPPEHEGSADG